VVEGGATSWSDWRRSAGLVRHLTRRHLAARYRGSALGFFWSLLNPVMMMCVYTLVFQYIFRLSAPGVPYPVFFLTGLLAWNFVQVATTNAAVSIVDGYTLILKASFPRIALPLAAVLSNAFNFLVALPILVVFCLLWGVVPGPALLLLPLALLQLLLLAVGLGLIAASLTPFFRDTEQLLEVLFVGWFFATPVLYPMSLAEANLPPAILAVYIFNPLAGAISLVRVVFLGEQVAPAVLLASLPGTLVILLCGLLLFRRLAPRFSSVA
jgi:ABC-type polysaccharide/polyol phosphate export permease